LIFSSSFSSGVSKDLTVLISIKKSLLSSEKKDEKENLDEHKKNINDAEIFMYRQMR